MTPPLQETDEFFEDRTVDNDIRLPNNKRTERVRPQDEDDMDDVLLRKPPASTMDTNGDCPNIGNTATTAAATTNPTGRSTTLIPAVSARFPTPLPRHLRFFGWVMALIIPSLFYLGPIMLGLPPFLYLVAPKAALALLLLDIVLLCYPHKPWPAFRSLFQLWYELFDFQHNLHITTSSSSKQGQGQQPEEAVINQTEGDYLTILAMHPHGVIPIQAFLWMACCDQYTPNLFGTAATTDVAMRLPLLRQVMLWATSGSASREVLHAGLERGQNLFLLPGGVAEIFLAQPGSHRIKARRRGLMRLALQTGAALVPMYAFGGNDMFQQLSSIGFLEKFSRMFRGGVTFYWGPYGLPMPYPIPIRLVIGEPIFPTPLLDDNNDKETVGTSQEGGRKKRTCQKIPNPSDEQIDELLERYMNAFHSLFDQYKAQAGYPNAQLEIE